MSWCAFAMERENILYRIFATSQVYSIYEIIVSIFIAKPLSCRLDLHLILLFPSFKIIFYKEIKNPKSTLSHNWENTHEFFTFTWFFEIMFYSLHYNKYLQYRRQSYLQSGIWNINKTESVVNYITYMYSTLLYVHSKVSSLTWKHSGEIHVLSIFKLVVYCTTWLLINRYSTVWTNIYTKIIPWNWPWPGISTSSIARQQYFWHRFLFDKGDIEVLTWLDGT